MFKIWSYSKANHFGIILFLLCSFVVCTISVPFHIYKYKMMKYENEYGRECVIIFNVVRFYYCVHKILYSPNEIIQSNYLKCSSSINFWDRRFFIIRIVIYFQIDQLAYMLFIWMFMLRFKLFTLWLMKQRYNKVALQGRPFLLIACFYLA